MNMQITRSNLLGFKARRVATSAHVLALRAKKCRRNLSGTLMSANMSAR